MKFIVRVYAFVLILIGYIILTIVQYRMNVSISKSQKNECTFSFDVSQYESILSNIFTNKETLDERCVRFCRDNETEFDVTEIKSNFNETLLYQDFEVFVDDPECNRLDVLGVYRSWKFVENWIQITHSFNGGEKIEYVSYDHYCFRKKPKPSDSGMRWDMMTCSDKVEQAPSTFSRTGMIIDALCIVFLFYTIVAFLVIAPDCGSSVYEKCFISFIAALLSLFLTILVKSVLFPQYSDFITKKICSIFELTIFSCIFNLHFEVFYSQIKYRKNPDHINTNAASDMRFSKYSISTVAVMYFGIIGIGFEVPVANYVLGAYLVTSLALIGLINVWLSSLIIYRTCKGLDCDIFYLIVNDRLFTNFFIFVSLFITTFFYFNFHERTPKNNRVVFCSVSRCFLSVIIFTIYFLNKYIRETVVKKIFSSKSFGDEEAPHKSSEDSQSQEEDEA